MELFRKKKHGSQKLNVKSMGSISCIELPVNGGSNTNVEHTESKKVEILCSTVSCSRSHTAETIVSSTSSYKQKFDPNFLNLGNTNFNIYIPKHNLKVFPKKKKHLLYQYITLK